MGKERLQGNWDKSKPSKAQDCVSLSQYIKHACLFVVSRAEHERDLLWSGRFGSGNNAA